jgi:Fe-S-cluster containining protein
MPDRLAELDRQVERGSLFAQAVFQREFARLERAESLLLRLVDRLHASGLVRADELGLVNAEADAEPAEAAEVAPGPEPDTEINWPTVALRVDGDQEDRRQAVDCAARMHICHAVCCRLKFPLSAAEVDAGAVKWDIGHPYIIRHDSSGWCTHNDRATGCCSVYEDRPGVCRNYSCAGDTRIWKDFDGMVLNQQWIDEHLVSRDLHVAAVVPPMDPSDEAVAGGAR